MTTHEGSCFCGAVQIAVEGEPVAAGYCHCASCRSWSAAPVNAFTLWKPDAVKVTRGESNIGAYRKTERSNDGLRIARELVRDDAPAQTARLEPIEQRIDTVE